MTSHYRHCYYHCWCLQVMTGGWLVVWILLVTTNIPFVTSFHRPQLQASWVGRIHQLPLSPPSSYFSSRTIIRAKRNGQHESSSSSSSHSNDEDHQRGGPIPSSFSSSSSSSSSHWNHHHNRPQQQHQQQQPRHRRSRSHQQQSQQDRSLVDHQNHNEMKHNNNNKNNYKERRKRQPPLKTSSSSSSSSTSLTMMYNNNNNHKHSRQFENSKRTTTTTTTTRTTTMTSSAASTRSNNYNSSPSTAATATATTGATAAAAIQFNKWLSRSLRERKIHVSQAEIELLQRVEAYTNNTNTHNNNNDTSSLSSSCKPNPKLLLLPQTFDSISFNIILNAWARERTMKAARRADSLLEVLHKLEQPYTNYYCYQQPGQNQNHPGTITTTTTLQADTYSYSAVLNAYAKSGGKRSAALRAEELLQQMEVRLGSKQLSSTDICHNAVMDCWSVSGELDAGRRAQVWLRKLQQNYNYQQQQLNSNSNPNSRIATTTTSSSSSFSRSLDGTTTAATSSTNHGGGGGTGPQATRISYNTCLKAWARSKPPQNAIQAHELLKQMKRLGGNLAPDKISYSTCIDAYCRAAVVVGTGTGGGGGPANGRGSGTGTTITTTSPNNYNWTWAATNAEALLREMEEQSSEYDMQQSQQQQQQDKKNHDNRRRQSPSSSSASPPSPSPSPLTNYRDLRPDVVAYTSVLLCYAKAGMDISKAMELISRMEKYAGQTPNTTFLNTLMHLFAKTGKVQHAEALLQSMKQSQMADKITYTTVISAHAHATNSLVNATRVRELLDELQHLYRTTGDERYLPSAKTFSSVFNAMSKSKPSMDDNNGKDKNNNNLSVLEQVDELLQRMEELYQETKHPDLRINTVVYSQVFQILSNNSRQYPTAAANRAIKLLEEMKRRQETNPQVRPDASTYAYFINTLTKSKIPNAAQLATEVLQTVEEGYEAGDDGLKPTKLLYSAVLQAYAKSASRDGAERAEQLLQRTQDLYQTKGKLYAKPTTLYYNAVIDAHARSQGGLEAALRAEALLLELETKCRARDDPELVPTTRSYNAVLLAWKNSNTIDAPQRAEALLKRMNERYKQGDIRCRPDRVTMNSIIGVWAKSGDVNAPARAEVFLQFMEKLYAEVGDLSLKPDSYSFNSVIDAYSRHQKQQQEQMQQNLPSPPTPQPSSVHTETAPSTTSPAPRTLAAVQSAEQLFQRMMALHQAGDKDIAPDVITLTSLRNAWAHCDHEDAPQRIRELSQMIATMRRGNQQQPTPTQRITVLHHFCSANNNATAATDTATTTRSTTTSAGR